MMCHQLKCKAPATRWLRLSWWCPKHAPATLAPDHACTHSLQFEVDGMTICSYCGGHL